MVYTTGDVTKETASIWSVDAIESIKFIQDSNVETFKNTVIGIIGNSYDPTKVYILWGCVNTGANYNISAGAVFYAGEIYTVDLTSFTPTNVAVGTMTSVGSGTLIKFSDNTYKDILLLRKFVITDGASGSGTSGTNGDFANWVSLSGLVRQGNIIRQIDTITAGNMGTGVDKVLHTITPATFNINNLKIDYSSSYAASADTAVILKLWKNPTIVGGNVTSGTILMSVSDKIGITGNEDSVISFTTMYNYAANDVLVITGNAASGTPGLQNFSNLIVDGISN